MVGAQAARLGDSPAVLAPGRDPVSFARLREHIHKTRLRLWELGVGRDDIVVNVLPNGSDAAVASLCVSSCATAAPLNPDLLQAEYERLFEELGPKIVLAQPGQAQPARDAAEARRIPVIDVVAEAEAGVFTLQGEAPKRNSARTGQLADSADIAYIITTSGSTARPKLVPLRHRVLCNSLAAVGSAIGLTPADRCLSFSPQFHLLGFSSGLLVPLGNGHSTVCTHGFHVDDFFQWLDEFQPTWFPAVPAILREILEHSSRHEAVLKRSSLRFLRTGGSPLPGPVAEKIEAVFGAPLLQVYGLSEAPCIALDHFPGERRRGSCGQPSRNDVLLVDGDGRPVSPGETGEVVVRGPVLIDGYFRNPELTRAAFRDGWFHTGDIGYFDADQYLFLTGRASEFINRGGEKVSPVEVDQMLMTHPDVAEAVTFSVPHDKLGEDVGAAVVLRHGASLTVAQLQRFTAARLAAHKLPRHIFFLDKMPLGPTGKVQRSKLWEYVSSPAANLVNRACPHVEPRDTRERRIAALFTQVLHRESVGIHDNFFDLGGDSLAATECAMLLEEEFGCPPLSPGIFLWAPTVAHLAEILADPACLELESDVLPFQVHGDGVPLFLINPGHEGARITRHLGAHRPMFGIPIPAPTDPSAVRSIDQMAAECIRVLLRFQPEGPYALVGWCAHGVVALEMARQLEQQGCEVSFVAMLDVRNFFLPPLSAPHLAWVRLWRRARRFLYVARHWPRSLWNRFRSAATGGGSFTFPETTQALFRHRPQPWAGRMVHVWASDWPRGRYFDPSFGWNHLAPNGFVFHQVPGDHLTMIQEPSVGEVARILAGELDRVQYARRQAPSYAAPHLSPEQRVPHETTRG
jgi:acyl-CoA synthetase (AMP-forming)/AMP-acid ligase II/thioesterase domain-containing protein